MSLKLSIAGVTLGPMIWHDFFVVVGRFSEPQYSVVCIFFVQLLGYVSFRIYDLEAFLKNYITHSK